MGVPQQQAPMDPNAMRPLGRPVQPGMAAPLPTGAAHIGKPIAANMPSPGAPAMGAAGLPFQRAPQTEGARPFDPSSRPPLPPWAADSFAPRAGPSAQAQSDPRTLDMRSLLAARGLPSSQLANLQALQSLAQHAGRPSAPDPQALEALRSRFVAQPGANPQPAQMQGFDPQSEALRAKYAAHAGAYPQLSMPGFDPRSSSAAPARQVDLPALQAMMARHPLAASGGAAQTAGADLKRLSGLRGFPGAPAPLDPRTAEKPQQWRR